MSAKRWSVASLTAAHQRIALDADVLIYLLEDVEPQASGLAAILDAIDQGAVRASMSSLAHAEVLVGPAKTGDAVRFEQTAAELRDVNVDVVPVTADVAEDAAWLRGQGSLQLIDAIHVATARKSATAFITNDRRIRSVRGLEVYRLDDLDLAPDSEPK
jgi:predicted nucleic acid-binding protein